MCNCAAQELRVFGHVQAIALWLCCIADQTDSTPLDMSLSALLQEQLAIEHIIMQRISHEVRQKRSTSGSSASYMQPDSMHP